MDTYGKNMLERVKDAVAETVTSLTVENAYELIEYFELLSISQWVFIYRLSCKEEFDLEVAKACRNSDTKDIFLSTLSINLMMTLEDKYIEYLNIITNTVYGDSNNNRAIREQKMTLTNAQIAEITAIMHIRDILIKIKTKIKNVKQTKQQNQDKKAE